MPRVPCGVGTGQRFDEDRLHTAVIVLCCILRSLYQSNRDLQREQVTSLKKKNSSVPLWGNMLHGASVC